MDWMCLKKVITTQTLFIFNNIYSIRKAVKLEGAIDALWLHKQNLLLLIPSSSFHSSLNIIFFTIFTFYPMRSSVVERYITETSVQKS